MEQIQKKSVLFLHGFTQNSKIFNKRLKVLTKYFNKHLPNFDFLIPDAPHIIEKLEQEPEDGYKRGWLYLNRENKLEFSQFENSDKIVYYGLQETLKEIEELCLKNNKNVECIFGFSQGSLIAIFLSLLYQNGKMKEIFPNLKCVVIVSGFIEPSPLNEEIKDLIDFNGKIELPSLHIYGNLDEFILPSKSEKATKLYKNPQIYAHPGKHFIPTSSQDLEIIGNFMKQHLI